MRRDFAEQLRPVGGPVGGPVGTAAPHSATLRAVGLGAFEGWGTPLDWGVVPPVRYNIREAVQMEREVPRMVVEVGCPRQPRFPWLRDPHWGRL